MYILENVYGILKCLDEIMKILRTQLPQYYHGYVKINAKDFDCVSRPRIYFIGVLRPVQIKLLTDLQTVT